MTGLESVPKDDMMHMLICEVNSSGSARSVWGLTYFRTPNQRKSVEPLNHYGIVVGGRTVDSFQSIGQPIRIRTRHDIPTHTVPTAAVHWVGFLH